MDLSSMCSSSKSSLWQKHQLVEDTKWKPWGIGYSAWTTGRLEHEGTTAPLLVPARSRTCSQAAQLTTASAQSVGHMCSRKRLSNSCKIGRWPTAKGRSGLRQQRTRPGTSPSVADRHGCTRGRRWPHIREGEHHLRTSLSSRGELPTISARRYGGGPPRPAPASDVVASWAVAYDCCVEAGSEGGGARPGSQVDGRRHGVRLGWTGAPSSRRSGWPARTIAGRGFLTPTSRALAGARG